MIAWRCGFRRLAAYVRVKHGLGEALHSASARRHLRPCHRGDRPTAAAAEAAGQLRAGLDPDDVLQLMSFLWRVGPGEAGLALADRLMELVLDGLRA